MTRTKLTLLAFVVGQLLLTNCGNNNSNKQVENTSSQEKTSEKKVAVILDLKNIAGKTKKEVETILGKAENREKVKGYPCEQSKCERVFYKSGAYEVIYKSNKADRITITNTPNLTSSEDAITKLGLPISTPAFKNPDNVIRWNNVENINEISFFTNYILIQVTQPD
jgi:outer membrane murein-binding lipoprotein Lpp